MTKEKTKKVAEKSAPSPKLKEKVSKGYKVTFGKGVTLGKGVK
jgi:hypothetical protein